MLMESFSIQLYLDENHNQFPTLNGFLGLIPLSAGMIDLQLQTRAQSEGDSGAMLSKPQGVAGMAGGRKSRKKRRKRRRKRKTKKKTKRRRRRRKSRRRKK